MQTTKQLLADIDLCIAVNKSYISRYIKANVELEAERLKLQAPITIQIPRGVAELFATNGCFIQDYSLQVQDLIKEALRK